MPPSTAAVAGARAQTMDKGALASVWRRTMLHPRTLSRPPPDPGLLCTVPSARVRLTETCKSPILEVKVEELEKSKSRGRRAYVASALAPRLRYYVNSLCRYAGACPLKGLLRLWALIVFRAHNGPSRIVFYKESRGPKKTRVSSHSFGAVLLFNNLLQISQYLCDDRSLIHKDAIHYLADVAFC